MSSNEISSLSLKRLFNRAGIKRVKHESYNQLLNYISHFCKQVLNDTNILIVNRKNKTITEDDLKKGLIINNLFDIIENSQNGGGNEDFCHGSPSQCGMNENTSSNYNNGNTQNGGTVDPIRNVFCNGMTSQCFYEDSLTNCDFLSGGNLSSKNNYVFSIPNTQFQRFLNTLGIDDIKMTKQSLHYLQYITEQDVINYLISKNKDQKEFDL